MAKEKQREKAIEQFNLWHYQVMAIGASGKRVAFAHIFDGNMAYLLKMHAAIQTHINGVLLKAMER